MYKIKYLTTGHEFVLPDETAKELKEKFPEDYQIIEKNGKKVREKIKKVKKQFDKDNIKDFVIDDSSSK